MHFSKGRSKPTPMVKFISGWNCTCNSTKFFFVVSFAKSSSEFQHKGRLAFLSHCQDINTTIFLPKILWTNVYLLWSLSFKTKDLYMIWFVKQPWPGKRVCRCGKKLRKYLWYILVLWHFVVLVFIKLVCSLKNAWSLLWFYWHFFVDMP